MDLAAEKPGPVLNTCEKLRPFGRSFCLFCDFGKYQREGAALPRLALQLHPGAQIGRAVLHDGQPNNGRVCCTGNRCESIVGYCTLWGDLAGDFAPLAILTKREVCELGKFMGLPDRLVFKAPSDGLTGKTDEESLGITYTQIEDYLANKPLEPEVAKKITEMVGRNQFKREIIHIPHP